MAIVDHFGGVNRVNGLLFDNPAGVILNYPQTAKWTEDDTSDVKLTTIGGVDVIIIRNPDRTLTGMTNQDKAVWSYTVYPTENLQRLNFMDPEEPTEHGRRPQETKIWT